MKKFSINILNVICMLLLCTGANALGDKLSMVNNPDKEEKARLERDIKYYTSLKARNSVHDAKNDIASSSVKIYYNLGFTMEPVGLPLDYKEVIPTFSVIYIGQGDAIVDYGELTKRYYEAHKIAYDYAEKYNKAVYSYYTKDSR